MIQAARILAIIMLFSFTRVNNMEEVAQAFASGQSARVGAYLDAQVAMSLPGFSETVSKPEAEAALQAFYKKYPVKSCKILHQGEKQGSEFFIASLQAAGTSFRLTVFLRNKENKLLIQKIRIEEG